MSAALIVLEERQRIGKVAAALLRDIRNAHGAIEHTGGAMPTTHFVMALINAVAEFCAERADLAAMAPDQAQRLLIDVFDGELTKALAGQPLLLTQPLPKEPHP